MAWQNWKNKKYKKFEKKEKEYLVCNECLGKAVPKKIVEVYPSGALPYNIVVCTKCFKKRRLYD